MKTSRSRFALALALGAWAITQTSFAQTHDSAEWRPTPEGLRSMADYFPFTIVEAGDEVLHLPSGEAIASDELDLDAYNLENGSTGMIVLHQGRIVYEAYFQGADENSRLNSWSMAKSITSTLIGIAENEGLIESIEDPIIRYVPQLEDTIYRDVTIEQAMQMSSGVAFDKAGGEILVTCISLPPGPVFADCEAIRERFPDFRSLLLSFDERNSPPGTEFSYNDGDTMVLGWVLENATGQSPAEYLSRKLWQPAGMEDDAEWLLEPGGMTLTGMSINARLRDFARFGLLMLNDGILDGQRLLPAGWVGRATTPGKPYLERLDPEVFGYQYQWWVVPDGLVVPGGTGAFEAQGAMGQFLHIDPEHELVVVMTSAWPELTGWNIEKAMAFHSTVARVIDVLGYQQGVR